MDITGKNKSYFSWLSIIVQSSFCAALACIFYLIGIAFPVSYALFIPLIFSSSMRVLFLNTQWKGRKLIRLNYFREAIPYFERNILFFKKYSWLDKWRHLLFFNHSKLTYKQIDLLNKAYCLIRIGDKEKALEIFRAMLKKHPNILLLTTIQDIIKYLEKELSNSHE